MRKENTSNRNIIATSGGEFKAAGRPLSVNGQPVQRFLKDMISCGVYKHPVHGWTLDVTPERLDNWTAAFKRMRENGVDIEVPIDHSMSAKDNKGYVIDMFKGGTPEIMAIYPSATDPKTLYGVHELIGQDSIELAGKCKNVSVLIEKDLKDGKGVSYGEAITHSSIVQQPVVPGQGGFIQLSRDGGVNDDIPQFVLSVSADNTNLENKKMNEETLKQLKAILGAGDDLTAENALTRVQERLAKADSDTQALSKQVTELTGKVESLEAKAASKVEIDPDAMDMIVSGTESRLSRLIECGKLSTAAADIFRKNVVGEQGKRNVLMLSRKASGLDESIAAKFLSILEANEPVKPGEKTGSQALSRNVPGENKEVDKAVQERMTKIASGQ